MGILKWAGVATIAWFGWEWWQRRGLNRIEDDPKKVKEQLQDSLSDWIGSAKLLILRDKRPNFVVNGRTFEVFQDSFKFDLKTALDGAIAEHGMIRVVLDNNPDSRPLVMQEAREVLSEQNILFRNRFSEEELNQALEDELGGEIDIK